jgi:hypothetical protein
VLLMLCNATDLVTFVTGSSAAVEQQRNAGDQTQLAGRPPKQASLQQAVFNS